MAQEDRDLETSDNWDFEKAEKRRITRRPRAIVSVAFPRQDFERVADYAERLGLKVSELIRMATLEKVRGGVTSASLKVIRPGHKEPQEIWLDRPRPDTESSSDPVEVAREAETAAG